ncbi:MAG: ATP-binding protein [Bacilli bacterium]|nr:ATP-binding protein [Bacilli bacterium]
MIIREKYLKNIRGFYDSDLVKVITGVRRSGKSVILETIMKEISEKTDNIIYLNFEKTSDFSLASTVEELVNYVKNNRKEGKCYCFFDEIQEINNWQVAVKDLRLDNCSIFVTGSNSKLLSSEFLTLLSGRFVSFRIRPFVYKEIKEYSKELGINIDVANYLIWGGFPGRFNNTSLEGTKAYLSDLESTIVVNDLIKRYKIKKEIAFKKVVNYILCSNSRIFSVRSIHKYMKNDFPDLALSTVARFVEWLKEAYIIDEIPQYSTKTKRELQYYGKIYNSDVSFNSLRANNNRYDLDHNLENVVYNELLYMGYELKVFTNNGKEIDFLASKDSKIFYIQVAYSVADEKAYEREMSAFANLDNLNQKILITNDIIDYSTSVVKHIKLEDFLMMEEL